MSASLLPPNATPLMRAIEQVTAQRLAALPVDTIRSLWDAETCPVEWLPLLAWGESADYWDTAWSESRRRAYVAALRAIHERKGTLGAVRDILAAVGHADATVEEHLHRWTLDGSVTLDVARTSGSWRARRPRIASVSETGSWSSSSTCGSMTRWSRCSTKTFRSHSA